MTYCYAFGFNGELVGGCAYIKRWHQIVMAMSILGGELVKENHNEHTQHN